MLMLLSPAKSLIEGPAVADLPHSTPVLLEETERLAKETRGLSTKNLKTLMGISDKLADLNHQRFQDFEVPLHPDTARQAVRMFNGGVYVGLDAATLSPDDIAFGQDTVAILSGFYGVLRPLDLMLPYRLEMGTKLENRRGPNLYAFWGERIAQTVDGWLADHDEKVIVNLASNEYFHAVSGALKSPVITPRFEDVKDGKSRVVSFFAKAARGMMVRWALQHRAERAEELKGFDSGGYTFVPDDSTDTRWVFRRQQPPPARR